MISKQQQEENDSQQYSLCPLSQPSKYLNDSLITDRLKQKQQFYLNFNQIYLKQQLKFQKWQDYQSKSYQIKQQDILNIIQINKGSSNHIYPTILTQIYRYFQMNKINLILYSFRQNHKGLRTFFNGIKRLFPILNLNQIKFSQSIMNCFNLLHENHLNNITPSQMIYNLTGWIPQEIVISQINNSSGVLQRLNRNFQQGNTIITFSLKENLKTKQLKNKINIFGLKDIDIKTKQISIFSFNQNIFYLLKQKKYNQIKKQKSLKNYEFKLSWQKFMELIGSIYVNWSPMIYQFLYKTQNIIYLPQTQDNSQLPEYNQFSQSNQFLLKIPPNQDDIQLRFLLETHYSLQQGKQNDQNLVIQLYDYQNGRIINNKNIIRLIEKKNTIFSDVFVFQSSTEKNQYVLVLRSKQKKIKKNIHYTFSLYSFDQVGFIQLPIEKVIDQKQINIQLTQSHTGYGINSPYFISNFNIDLSFPKKYINKKLKILTIMPNEQNQFQLYLIPNPNKQKNVTRLNLQTILTDITCTEKLQNHGLIQLDIKSENYFFMINNYVKLEGQVKIILQIVDKQSQKFKNRNTNKLQNCVEGQNSLVMFKQIKIQQQPIIQKQFKWQVLHSGPRKRLKSNTNQNYQAASVFRQFFNNPYFDYQIANKSSSTLYQFSVQCQSYKQIFNRIQQIQDKEELQPPTLSLAILKINQQNNTFKIVSDDAFYVPFGFGFWSKLLKLQNGMYRFIFPKMEKQKAQGKFKIFQIQQ